MPITYDQLKLSASARPLVDRLLARAATEADKMKVKDALVKAAGADLNKVLSAHEVQAVVDSFQAVAPGDGLLTAEHLGLGLGKAATAIKSMEALGNLDGISTDFTLDGTSVEAKLIAELNASVARANGKKMDVNMTIFEFQSDAIEKAIVDIAKKNPNVTFRIIADSTQASDSGGNALPNLVRQNLPNVHVKYKKDFPYVWNPALGRPDYNHGSTSGLNHHKGFAAFIDGRPDVLSTGSFNWSATADTKNYEDLTTFVNTDSSSRRAIEQFGDEFAGYWNNDSATLSPNSFANFKGTKWNEMLVAHGKAPTAKTDRPDDSLARYSLPVDARTADLNSFSSTDNQRLAALLGSNVANAVIADRKKLGRFASLDELKERVPGVATVAVDKLEALHFGSGLVSINTATANELDQVGFTAKQAQAIVKTRTEKGDFESVDDLLKVPGLTAGTLDKLRSSLSPIDVDAFFNSRAFGDPAAGTGYGSAGGRTTAAIGPDGQVAVTKASVVVAATDLFNRTKPPQEICVAMYGMSPSAPEVKSLAEAAKRGVKVRVVLNDDYSESTVSALKALSAQGFPVDVRVQKAKTMHEKFGVVGDDVFFGSANFSESSSTKHSENRFSVKNHPETAAAFQSRFEVLWSKSKVV